jgi:uncharacterized protein involved in exopolysaccharide biosynthesis
MQLSNLKSRFTDAYPDVIKTKAEIEKLQKQIDAARSEPNTGGIKPDNPAYITLASQLASTQADIQSVKRNIVELQKKGDTYRKRIEATPKVEEYYKSLLIERDNTQAKYDDLSRKYMEANVAHGLEKEQKGERFTLIDPARLPEKPYKPNRMAIMMIGLILGVAAGAAAVSVQEFTDHSIRGADELALETSLPVLAGIPEIVTPKDLKRKNKLLLLKAVTAAVVVLGGMLAVHYWVMDLNIFWAKLMRRLTL